MNDEDTTARPGSLADLSRRMDRMERRQEQADTKVTDLGTVVARVEANQAHAIELNQLRFNALDNGMKAVSSEVALMRTDFAGFVNRVNALISGEASTTQGRKMLEEYEDFKRDTERRLAKHDTFETQGRLLGRIAVILVSTQVVSIVVAIGAAVAAITKTS